jgi:CDP-diacylglycerol--serine O-phosphatidyltransferase
MKPIRAVSVFPTLFTLGNLLCGFFAVVVASRIEKPTTADFVPAPRVESPREVLTSEDPTQNLMFSGSLILLAMVFDAVDGQMARITRSMSDFGAQLDSLCDLMSFGMAPAFLLVKMCPRFTSVHNQGVWIIAAVFVCCAALRLARFNVEMDEEDDHTTFAGLPSPAAAAVIASFAILSYRLRSDVTLENFSGFDLRMQQLVPLFAIAIALLMVSRIPYPHPLSQIISGQRSFAHVVAVLFFIGAIWFVGAYAVPLLCVMFVIGPPLRYAWDLVRHRRRKEEPLF